MKNNIKYSLFGLVAALIFFSISVVALTLLIMDNSGGNEVRIVGYGVLFVISVILLLISIRNIQWFDVANGNITVHCPFGIVKQAEFGQIKTVFKTNLAIFNINMIAVRQAHFVLCLEKTVAKNNVISAYNRNKKPYIIIPYSKKTEDLICTEYKKFCGEDLTINL